MKITFRDTQYQTIEECYKANKDIARVGIGLFAKRLGQGLSVEEALTRPSDRTLISHRGTHTVEGVEYVNLPSIARAYGIGEWGVYRRYYNGLRGDDLVPPKKRKSYVPPEPKKPKREVEIGGVTYKSISAACRALGVKYHTYKNRRRIGCTLEQCLGVEAYPRRRKTFEIDGELLGFNEIEQKFEIKREVFARRLRMGMTIEEALSKKLYER